MKYDITITEILKRKIEIEAYSYGEAIEKAKKMYYDCELILDASDLVEQEFK